MEYYVSGPGIDKLKSVSLQMLGRGAPNKYDFTGFNKIHHEFFANTNFNNISANKAGQLLKALGTYRKTQLPSLGVNYDELVKEVQADIERSKPEEFQSTVKPQENQVIFFPVPDKYGKYKLVFSSNDVAKAAKSIIDLKHSIENVTDGWKRVTFDKNELNAIWIIKPELQHLIRGLRSVQFINPQGNPIDINQHLSVDKNYRIIGKDKDNNIIISLPKHGSISYFDMKKDRQTPSVFVANKTPEGEWVVIIRDLAKAIEYLNGKGIDTPDLNEELNNIKNKENEQSPLSGGTSSRSITNSQIEFEDRGKNIMSVKVPFQQLSANQKEEIKDLIKHIFPNYSWEGSPSWKYTVSGDYTQYIHLGQILQKPPFNFPTDSATVESLRKIVKNKVASGDLDASHKEGVIKSDLIDQIDKKLPNNQYDLYDAQKEGIAWLESRKSAILGDETGLGKTVQLVSAAELVMQNNHKDTLIITLKGVTNQWVDTIKNVAGPSEPISLNPFNPQKWTILYYENFSSGLSVEDTVQSINKHNFGIIIFDELHKVKHATSKRWQNIDAATNNIPVRWGATATLSSNKPADVRNQLRAIKNYLGDIKEKTFKFKFGGGNSEEEKIKSAEKLNKWLNLTGVYVRRSKSDIRKMPDLTVKHETIDADENTFISKYNQKLNLYKNQELAISQLIAARSAIAETKVPETTKKVLDIVEKNDGGNPAASKVVVFTNFKESGKALKENIGKGLQEINPNYKVITYMSDTSKMDKLNVKKLFNNDPNNKVLIMSMKMGGTGIDFPNAAQNMVINDFDWTPEAAEQSEGRIYRINTNHPVNIDYIVSNGIDSNLYNKVQLKRRIAKIIQEYRKEYQVSSHEKSEKILNNIVKLRKQFNALDKEIVDDIAGFLNEIKPDKNESFKSYIDNYYKIIEIL